MEIKVTIEFKCDIDIDEATIEQVENYFYESEDMIGVYIDNYSVINVEKIKEGSK